MAKFRAGWACYLLVALVLAVAYFVLPHTALNKLVLYNGLGLSAVIATLVGIRRRRPAHPGPWYLFAAGQASFLTGDVIYYVMTGVLHVDVFPGPADAFYQLMYPLVILGLVLLTRRVLPGRDLPSLIDASIIATSVFVLLWVTVMDKYAVDSTVSTFGRSILLGQPTFDVLLLLVAIRLVVVLRTKSVSFLLLTLGVAGLLAADISYAVVQLTTGYQTGGLIDVGWMCFYVMFGAAALHPSMSTLTEQPVAVGGRLTRKRLAVLSLTTMAVPVLDLLSGTGNLIDRTMTTAGAMLLFALVLFRVVGLVRTVEEGQEQLRHETLHDSLTGLANRVLFEQQVQERLSAPHSPGRVAVLFVDLDDFKTVNDSQGHAAGDELLQVVAERLRSCLSQGNIAARLGGDEFAILLGDVRSSADAAHVAERVLEAMGKPVQLGDRETFIAASVGIAVQSAEDAGAESTDAESLLRGADVAMYLAKSKGKGRYEFFQQSMYDEMLDRLQLKADLGMALEHDELELAYQPIVALGGGMTGVEALLRWNHPTRGLINPVDFIPLAEESGLIVPIGRWVLQQACVQAQEWQQLRPESDPLGISVNISVRQLQDAHLVDDVAEALRSSGLTPRLLTVEITESVLMSDGETNLGRLERIRQLGVRVAIDDFGTGYSSLSYLQKFPVDTIKIDRSFVMALADSDNSRSSALIRSVVDLSSALHLVTVAEGIEDAAQLSALEGLNCQLGQGYFFSRPINAAALTSLLGTTGAPADGRSALGSSSRVGDHVVEVHRGSMALERVAADIDDLHAALGVPVNARRAWLSTWVATQPAYEPWAVVVRRPGDAGISGAALLAARPDERGLRVVSIGHGSSGLTMLPARAGSADALAEAVVALLGSLHQEWTLHLEQLPANDPVALGILARLGDRAELNPDLRVPRVTLNAGTDLRDYLSRNTHRTLKKARNRLIADGLNCELAFARDPGAVAQLLGEIEEVHRRRDHDLERNSDLDDLAGLEFWRRVILQHSLLSEIEIATLRFNGELAAYVVSLLDGTSYRVFDGRFDSRFAEYAPGRLTEAETLRRVLQDDQFTELDWWSGLSSEKLLTENVSSERQWLAAASTRQLLGNTTSSRDAAEPGTLVQVPAQRTELAASPQVAADGA